MYTHKLPSDDELVKLWQWHKHRLRFCVWYVEVGDELARYCQTLQQRFAQFLSPHYQRQFHVTLFVNGFWVAHKRYDDDFDGKDLKAQINALTLLNLPAFELTLGDLYAFDNCLSIQILPHDCLNDIRGSLSACHQEISPSIYVPHITLGFYRARFLKQDILNHISQLKVDELSFGVTRLICGTYQATKAQGRLSPISQIIL